jgi:hypothetical protein
METPQLAMLAGMISTVLFAASNIPMLVKAFRTKDLQSYSLTYLVLVNLGNGIHWFYIAELPFGPLWVLHSFYTLSASLRLVWYLPHRKDGFRRAC